MHVSHNLTMRGESKEWINPVKYYIIVLYYYYLLQLVYTKQQ